MLKNKGMADRHSVYYECSAEEVCKKSMRNVKCYNNCACIIVLGLMVYCMLTAEDRSVESFLSLLLAIAVIHSMRINVIRNGVRLHEILTLDCDSVKFLQVMEYKEEAGQSKKGGQKASFVKILGCRHVSGKLEEGFAELMEYKSPKLTWGYEINRLNEIVNYTFVMKDKDRFMQAKEELETLPERIQKHNKREEKLYNNVMKMVRLKMLFWDECNEEARQLANEFLQADKTRYDMIFVNMILAQLDLREKRYDEAREHLEFVICEGNTLAMVNDAKRLLEEMKELSM